MFVKKPANSNPLPLTRLTDLLGTIKNEGKTLWYKKTSFILQRQKLKKYMCINKI